MKTINAGPKSILKYCRESRHQVKALNPTTRGQKTKTGLYNSELYTVTRMKTSWRCGSRRGKKVDSATGPTQTSRNSFPRSTGTLVCQWAAVMSSQAEYGSPWASFLSLHGEMP
ncbi:unnamed protein product [Albugo candida]|uniref:Uncharacterized protein n=1 Tax=Albugo candida TaxID=65357 RepID=A0A024GRB6_9STRA|nr:unnamed protein product [Albugo candida]|eukprot:CCI49278.1 unnamed protein product [Albugo candida]